MDLLVAVGLTCHNLRVFLGDDFQRSSSLWHFNTREVLHNLDDSPLKS